jgi:hypothetical protein
MRASPGEFFHRIDDGRNAGGGFGHPYGYLAGSGGKAFDLSAGEREARQFGGEYNRGCGVGA